MAEKETSMPEKETMAEKKNAKKLLAPVPSADDYSVSAELWQRLQTEIISVSNRITAGDELMPDDVANVKQLKSQVDNYVSSFNKAMRNDMEKYRKMVDKMLTELGYNEIEQFILKKRQEQTDAQNDRIACKMATLKELSDGLLAHTERLKDIPISKELLPAFIARFPKVQSGAKTNDISDWKPYFAVMSHTITVMDTFFRDPKYEDAAMLPIHSGTMRELLAYAKDGKDEHILNVPVKFEQDQQFISDEKLKSELKSKAGGIIRIKQILDDMGDMEAISDSVKQVRTEQTWGEISRIVRLVNNL